MSMFHSCHLLFDYFRFALIHGLSIPGSCVILFFTTPITSHIHNWVCFFFVCLFVLFCFGSVSSIFLELFSTLLHIILGTCWPGEFIFQCPIFLHFHTIHGVLKARVLKWFAIPFSSGPHFIRTFHHDPSILVALHGIAHSFIELDKAVVHEISLISFLWLWFSFCLPSEGREVNGTPLQYFCLENLMDGGAW